MKLKLDPLELSTVIASLGKSRHYFEYVRKDQRTANSLQQNKAQANKTRRKRRNL
jgi:hypothetical protein